jgi:hypothetical protein
MGLYTINKWRHKILQKITPTHEKQILRGGNKTLDVGKHTYTLKNEKVTLHTKNADFLRGGEKG